MKSIMNSFVESASVKKSLIATAIFLFFLWLVDYSPIGVAGLLKITGGANILDYETRYTVEEGYRMLSNLGQEGRYFHLTKIMPVDIFFPFSLMLAGFCWMSYFLKKITKSNCSLRFLPLICILNMLLDWTENIGITAMLINYPRQLPFVCRTTGIISSAKMCCVLAIIIIMTGLILSLVVKSIISVIQKGKQIER